MKDSACCSYIVTLQLYSKSLLKMHLHFHCQLILGKCIMYKMTSSESIETKSKVYTIK